MVTDYSTVWLDNYRGDGLYMLQKVGHFDTKGTRESRFFRSKQSWALHYVQRGSGRLIVRGRQYDICSGMFFLTPPFEPINYYGDECDPWRYFYFSAYPESAIDIFKLFSDNGNGFVKTAKHPQKTLQIFEDVFKNREKSNEDMYFFALNALNRLLSLEFTLPRKISTPEQKTARLVNDIKEIMHFNYKNPEFSISDISEMLHINSSQLSRAFRQEAGETPISYLVNMRLEHSASLLEGRSLSIAELCRESGFNDECYFMKRFKRKFGMSVKEYRKKKCK